MSTFTVSYPVSRRLFEEFTLHCPKCGKPMAIFNLWKIRRHQRDRHEGAVAECYNGCRAAEYPEMALTFYSYDVQELKLKVQRIEKQKIFEATDDYCKQRSKKENGTATND